MPLRVTPLVTGEIYHVFNRSVDRQPIFVDKKVAKRAVETISFYRFANPTVRYSYFLHWEQERKKELLDRLEKKNEVLVSVLSFCLMPNHFHLLLRQEKEDGISKFLAQFQNSYTRYFNTLTGRVGHLFLGQFKAVRIETEEQLVHVSRYIHLNPYTSFVVKRTDDLFSYPWSSLRQYLGKEQGFIESETILTNFRGELDYQRFVFDQADYQRELGHIKHLMVEK